MALRGKASGDMHQRLQQAHLVEHLVLTAQLVEVIVQARLALTDQAGQGNGGANIGKRVVGLPMLQAVRRGEHFQLQRQPAVQLRPLDALRAQGIGGTDHVDQVPAAIAALPLACVGIEEVAVQAVARHFVVEAQGVVAGHAGRRLRQLGVYPGHEVGLGQPRSASRWGVMPVIRQAIGWGRISSLGRQYRFIGSPISFSASSVRIPAICNGRSRRGSMPVVS